LFWEDTVAVAVVVVVVVVTVLIRSSKGLCLEESAVYNL
jgi:hypothetical protein